MLDYVIDFVYDNNRGNHKRTGIKSLPAALEAVSDPSDWHGVELALVYERRGGKLKVLHTFESHYDAQQAYIKTTGRKQYEDDVEEYGDR